MTTQAELPSYLVYSSKVCERTDLTLEQKIILNQTYNLYLQGKPVHTHFLMQCTGLSWKHVNYLINGLSLRGAIKKIDKYHVTTKINEK
jgi:hypothetical protein